MEKITLNKITINQNKVDYYFSVTGSLKNYFQKENHLFLEYNYDLNSVPKSILTIPFVSNVLPLAWLSNSIIIIDELDQSFYESLKSIKDAYQQMFPSFNFKGELRVNHLQKNFYTPERDAATLFSGGLDALTTFIRTKEKNPLLVTEYGWHENEIAYSEVWEEDKKNAIKFAHENNSKNILIQSNYGTFLKFDKIDKEYSKKLGDTWWHGLHHGLAIISAAIPIAFKLKVKCIYIASSNTANYKVACASDPSVDNKIKFGSGSVFHDGYELTRQDKVKVVVDYYRENKVPINIRVCFKNKENCCKCEKCLRTILGIIAEDEHPEKFGFLVSRNLSDSIRKALNNEVKFFTETFIIIYWESIQQRIKDNYDQVLFKELANWFLKYNFRFERKKWLLHYRITNFFPILERKLKLKIRNNYASE